MSYSVITHYDTAGYPSWPKDSKPYRLVFAHTTEGGTGVAGALSTLAWMVQTASTRNASYHEFWAWDGSSFTAIRVLRPNRAAGSVNPNPPDYAPDSLVQQYLGANTWDPNQGGYSVSIAGTTTQVGTWAKDPDFIAACRRRLVEIRAELGTPALAEHFRINPSTRTDWGKVLTPALGGNVINYPILPDTGTGADMPDLTTFQTGTAKIDKSAWIRHAPVLSDSTKWFLSSSTEYSYVPTFIGWVKGDEYPSGSGNTAWGVYRVLTSDPPQWAYTHKVNILEVVSPEADCSTQEAKIDAQAATIDQQTATIQQQTSTIASQKTSIGQLTSERDQAKAQVSALDTEIVGLNSSIGQKNAALDSVLDVEKREAALPAKVKDARAA